MKASGLTVLLVATLLCGCSGATGLTTGSLFGSGEEAKPAATGPANDPPMRAFQVGTVSARAIKCGCSGATGLTTGSLFGSGEEAKPAATGPANDPPMRAFQVGTVSARAIKCGFNFDPAKLKTNYLAYERALAGPTGDLAKIEKIKADLGRHLAGDYTPSAQPKPKEEEGLFSGWGSGGSDDEGMKTTIPLDNSNI